MQLIKTETLLITVLHHLEFLEIYFLQDFEF